MWHNNCAGVICFEKALIISNCYHLITTVKQNPTPLLFSWQQSVGLGPWSTWNFTSCIPTQMSQSCSDHEHQCVGSDPSRLLHVGQECLLQNCGGRRAKKGSKQQHPHNRGYYNSGFLLLQQKENVTITFLRINLALPIANSSQIDFDPQQSNFNGTGNCLHYQKTT